MGHFGLAQFNPETAKRYGITRDQLQSTDRNDMLAVLNASASYLSDLKDKYDGDIGLALAAYNGAANSIDKLKKKNNGNISYSDWKSHIEKLAKKQGKKGYLQTKKHSFLNETISYVDKITTQDTDDFIIVNLYTGHLRTLIEKEIPFLKNPLRLEK